MDLTKETQLNIYESDMRLAQLKFIQRINELRDHFSTDSLLRRSYLGSLYNVCITALLEREEFSDLRRNFPSLQFPLAIIPGDSEALEESHLGELRLKPLIEKYLRSFEPFRFSKPEGHMRAGIWAPLLTDLLSFVSGKYKNSDLVAVNELSSKVFHTISLTRFVDFAACARGLNGLPVLLIEMAESEVESGGTHKDFRKQCLMMVFSTSELINRAGILCPDEDLTKFRTYGILISGRVFELCACTVIKGQDGKYGFVFHSNDVHWKFSLFGEELRVPADQMHRAGHFICDGIQSIIGSFVDAVTGEMFERVGEVEGTGIKNLFEDNEILESVNDFEESQFHDRFVGPPENFERSLSILLKFFEDMMLYYINLPDCLRSAYGTTPNYVSNEPLTIEFPSTLPHLPKSHARTTPVLDSITATYSLNQIKNELNNYYTHLLKSRFPTLPDVIYFNQHSNLAYIRQHILGLEEYSLISSENFHSSLIEVQIAKVVLDLYLAVQEIHAEGFVCGAVESKFAAYDGLHWRLSKLPRLVKSSEAHLVDVKSVHDFTPQFHILNSGFSQRDDLVGISRIVEQSFSGRMYVMMDRKEHYPKLNRFLDVAYVPLCKFKDSPEIDPIEYLQETVILYADMIKTLDVDSMIFPWKRNQFDPASLMVPLFMTADLARNKLGKLKQNASVKSIEKQYISISMEMVKPE